jgi:dTMP kinase
MRSIYGIALVPDAIFYLRIRSAEELGPRVLASRRGFDYWESGMDLHLGEDFYDSFIEYQKRLLAEFDTMSGEYGFRVIDASRSVGRVASDLRRAVKRVIDDGHTHDEADPIVEPKTTGKKNRRSSSSVVETNNAKASEGA